MQVPEFQSEEVDETITSYLVPIPVESDSLQPSLAIADDVCYFGTSDPRTRDLISEFDSKPTETGGRLHLNFAPLARTAIAWAELARDGEVPGTEYDSEDDRDTREIANIALALQGLELLEAFGTIDHRFYDEEDGQFRSSLHWLFRDIISTN